mmetsp:Transcript_96559/g.249675  ORF Transcript_96559/g.249675 Transcript_96559/m.249675 type:complete len:221 (-) Transcript_96559:9-671(-)
MLPTPPALPQLLPLALCPPKLDVAPLSMISVLSEIAPFTASSACSVSICSCKCWTRCSACRRASSRTCSKASTWGRGIAAAVHAAADAMASGCFSSSAFRAAAVRPRPPPASAASRSATCRTSGRARLRFASGAGSRCTCSLLPSSLRTSCSGASMSCLSSGAKSTSTSRRRAANAIRPARRCRGAAMAPPQLPPRQAGLPSLGSRPPDLVNIRLAPPKA